MTDANAEVVVAPAGRAIAVQDFEKMVGTKIATSDWISVEQERITRFADVTHDHQSIHIDPEAGRQAGFGGAIAHGFLSLSLLSAMASSLPALEGQVMTMNYGFDRIRFLAPVAAGSRVRANFTLSGVAWRGADRLLMTLDVVISSEDSEAPVVAATWLAMIFFQPQPERS